jgi:hypothetical protein
MVFGTLAPRMLWQTASLQVTNKIFNWQTHLKEKSRSIPIVSLNSAYNYSRPATISSNNFTPYLIAIMDSVRVSVSILSTALRLNARLKKQNWILPTSR